MPTTVAVKKRLMRQHSRGAIYLATGAKCLDSLQPKVFLVIWRLDRLGRSMRHFITLMEDLRDRGCDRPAVAD